MIRIGIVGTNYGRAVLLPAFRADARCVVVAIAGSDAARTRKLAAEAGIATAHQSWQSLVDDPGIDAIAIAVPPSLQPQIAIGALRNGKAVFVEKPLAAHMRDAEALRATADQSGKPVMIDFEFPELPAWQRAKELTGSLGALRAILVTWHVENYATRTRQRSWKTSGGDGGGVLGNFVSHCFHYLEDFGGPIRDLSARLFDLPGTPPMQASANIAGTFTSGASFALSMSCAAFLGTGHRIEICGEDGTLVLENPTSDYLRGFTLRHARRPATALEMVDIPPHGGDPQADGRIAPVGRLAARFLDAIERGSTPSPGIREACRVQQLIEAAAASHAKGGSAVMVTA